MKIGLSYSRCVRDIVEGLVDSEDVLVVIARTDFDPTVDAQWDSIWNGYTSGRGLSAREWSNYSQDRKEDFRNATIDLWESGKLHQPRKFGAYPRRLPYYWLETVVSSEEQTSNPALKQAWDQYQLLAGLSTKQKEFGNDF